MQTTPAEPARPPTPSGMPPSLTARLLGGAVAAVGLGVAVRNMMKRCGADVTSVTRRIFGVTHGQGLTVGRCYRT